MLNLAYTNDFTELEGSVQAPPQRLAVAGGSDVPPPHGDGGPARSAEIVDLAAARRAREHGNRILRPRLA
jgi:hypothetical protein